MTFADKLQKLLEDRSKPKVARRAGISPTAVYEYISKRYIPRAPVALNLARALNVSVEWLIDDEQGWPPIWRNSPSPKTAKVA